MKRKLNQKVFQVYKILFIFVKMLNVRIKISINVMHLNELQKVRNRSFSYPIDNVLHLLVKIKNLSDNRSLLDHFIKMIVTDR